MGGVYGYQSRGRVIRKIYRGVGVHNSGKYGGRYTMCRTVIQGLAWFHLPHSGGYHTCHYGIGKSFKRVALLITEYPNIVRYPVKINTWR